MTSGIWLHKQVQELLAGKDYREEKRVIDYKGISLVAKADFMPPSAPDEVWEFKTSEKLMEKSKPWADHQVKMYTSIFEKPIGKIFQPVKTDKRIYLKCIGEVTRDDAWYKEQL